MPYDVIASVTIELMVAFVSLASVVDAPLNSGGEIERRKERRY